MPTKSSIRGAFYDTVVFVLSLNTGDKDCPHCQALLDTSQINWSLAFSAISRAEAPIGELLDAFVTQCAFQGVDLREIDMPTITKSMKDKQNIKKRLTQTGMASRDIKQAFAASAAGCRAFITRDWDFKNPKNKVTRSGKNNTTQNEILKEFNLHVCLPHEARTHLHQGESATK